MNRTLIGLAIGAGYVLGRTKKLKLAMAAGTLIAGKRLNLSPGAVADLVSRQLKDNPQFKQIGDELRQDLSGVGKAASGALVERQMDALADRLHGRTADVRDQLAGVVETGHDEDEEDQDEADQDEEQQEEKLEDRDESLDADESEETSRKRAARKAPAPAKKSASQTAPKTAKKSARKAPAKKTAPKKTAGARKPAARTPSRATKGKGGGER
ncbi:DNA primase [Streptomyces sp. NPDC051954]|uniref:DNA primase n=1 Tax=Streptomyces sp. NPDC051954 TaxID=3155524 RepID=UPI00342E49AF